MLMLADPTWWRQLCRAVGTATASEMRAVIQACYEQRWRRYHNLEHVERVLHLTRVLSERYELPMKNPTALRLAVIFHDVIYAPGQHGCEEASALCLGCFAIDADLYREAARLIRLTEDHQPQEDDTDGILICDADLFDLSDPRASKRNRFNIKQEASQCLRTTDEEFGELWNDGRREWIETFLKRLKIYHGPGMEDNESRAREYLQREARQLERQA